MAEYPNVRDSDYDLIKKIAANTAAIADGGGGGGGTWGSITGTLSNQVDLQSALDAKTASAVVPSTAPSSGQILVGNAGGTAYAPKTVSGDLTLASTGAATIANAAVTLAKMADLAQDQFIVRTTASTGVPQTATVTAAARTVLDDTTVGAMVDTLGGASSLGTGGLVRGSGAALTSATITTGLTPTSNDGAALGSTSNQFSDLFLAEGAVINFDNGDATITQVGNVVTVAGAALANSSPGTAANSVATIDGTQTLTNKRITSRVQTAADATSITPDADSYDIVAQVNTQSAGTLTINAPTGTPTDGQRLTLRLKSSNAQTFSFNAIYRWSADLPAPTVGSGAGGSAKTDYIAWQYNSTDTKWDALARNFAF